MVGAGSTTGSVEEEDGEEAVLSGTSSVARGRRVRVEDAIELSLVDDARADEAITKSKERNRSENLVEQMCLDGNWLDHRRESVPAAGSE